MANLLQALRDPNHEVRAAVAAALVTNATEEGVKLPPAIAAALKQALPNVLASLKNGDPQARLDVILVLNELGPAAPSAVPALREVLLDENWLIRYGAAVALLKINPRETTVVPVLTDISHDPRRVELLAVDDGYIDHDELKALGKIASPEAISVLINLLQVSDEKFRYTHYWEDMTDQPAAAHRLREIGPQAIPALIAALKNDNVRFLVADTLGYMGYMGPQAIPPLMAIVQQHDNKEPGLTEILRDKNADLRRSAVYALGQMGIGEFLRDQYDEKTGQNRQKIPKYKSRIIKILYDIIQDQREPVSIRWLAAASLYKMGENVDNFFIAQNLPKPEGENCLACVVDSHFDLYAARCLFAVRPPLGGGYELFKLVHDLMSKTSPPGSTTPQSQPASTGR